MSPPPPLLASEYQHPPFTITSVVYKSSWITEARAFFGFGAFPASGITTFLFTTIWCIFIELGNGGCVLLNSFQAGVVTDNSIFDLANRHVQDHTIKIPSHNQVRNTCISRYVYLKL